MIKKKPNKRIAKQAAENLLKVSSLKLDPPILLNDIVKHLQLTKDLAVKGQDMSDKFSGIFVVQNNTYGILYNSSMPKNRIRFTVAHELGHLMLGHQFDKKIINEAYDLSKQKDWWELEANTFAANLLMPEKILAKDTKVLKKGDILTLAEKYMVSEAAMQNRIFFSNKLLGVSSAPYFYKDQADEE